MIKLGNEIKKINYDGSVSKALIRTDLIWKLKNNENTGLVYSGEENFFEITTENPDFQHSTIIRLEPNVEYVFVNKSEYLITDGILKFPKNSETKFKIDSNKTIYVDAYDSNLNFIDDKVSVEVWIASKYKPNR